MTECYNTSDGILATRRLGSVTHDGHNLSLCTAVCDIKHPSKAICHRLANGRAQGDCVGAGSGHIALCGVEDRGVSDDNKNSFAA